MNPDVFQNAKAVLLDLDGVLYVGDRAIEGAAEAIEYLKARGIPRRFVTNTTTKSLATLHKRLVSMGLPIEREEVVTAGFAGVLFLEKIGKPPCYFVLDEDTRRDYAGIPETDRNPSYVVIGDIGGRWEFGLVNRLFRMLMDGAELIALHKGRYFQVSDGLEIDTGAFVSGLEYATGKKATVIGKPQASFFRLALEGVGVDPERAVMIGDDLVSDVGGAQAAGLRGVLVRTGKFRPEIFASSEIEPDAVLDSVRDIVGCFD